MGRLDRLISISDEKYVIIFSNNRVLKEEYKDNKSVLFASIGGTVAGASSDIVIVDVGSIVKKDPYFDRWVELSVEPRILPNGMLVIFKD